jgi:hypothetical protein
VLRLLSLCKKIVVLDDLFFFVSSCEQALKSQQAVELRGMCRGLGFPAEQIIL